MFSLTVTDHVRLDSEHVAQNYMVHARAADRLATLAFVGRIIVAALLAAALAASIANLILPSRSYQVGAVATIAAALVGFALYAVVGLEGRVLAHRSFAHRLWLVAEQYRALVSESDEGMIDRATLLARRDDLIAHVHAIYERGFGADQRGYESARLAALPREKAA